MVTAHTTNENMENKLFDDPVIFTSDQKLLALSWKQPYAELMLHGKIETRTWNTNYRGWVLICASQKGYDLHQVFNISGTRQAERMVAPLGRNYDHFLRLYRSGIAIAIGRLIDCRHMKPEDENGSFVQYHPDLFCHFYDHIQAIEPFLWKGSQGWKEVSSGIKNQIKIVSSMTDNNNIK